jgi:hypothetical protein
MQAETLPHTQTNIHILSSLSLTHLLSLSLAQKQPKKRQRLNCVRRRRQEKRIGKPRSSNKPLALALELSRTHWENAL